MQWKLIHPACGGPAMILNREICDGMNLSAADVDEPPDLVDGLPFPPCLTCGDELGGHEAFAAGIVEPRGGE